METESDIAKWYQGRTVFITGATGFMGKVLLEKLLRSCPDVGPIYILVREKRNMLTQDRVEKMMKSSAFEEIRAMGINPTDRIFPISGDIGHPDLKISAEDRHLLQATVSVVFHLAATVRFDEVLRHAVAMNLEGTRALMHLCLGMTSLSAIVHVSTAYTNCNLSIIEERVYSPPADPDKITHCVAGLDDDLLESVALRLMGNHPNTYTFTKALAEHVVAGYSTKLPVVVVRPSIVSASWREPSPGWVDNFNGPTGLVVGAGKGLFKTVFGRGQLAADLIPVDVCINLFIAAAWEIGTKNGTQFVSNIRVYNCVSRPFKSLSWNEFVSAIDRCTNKYAMNDVLTSPKIRMTGSRVKHALSNILEQALPATLADICIWLSGAEPKFRCYQSKLTKMAALLEFFTTNEFEFNVENVEELKRRLNPADRMIFNFDLTKIDWEEYLERYFLGIRKHVMKEKDETIHSSRQRMTRWTLLKNAVQIVVLGIIVVISYSRIHLSVISS